MGKLYNWFKRQSKPAKIEFAAAAVLTAACIAAFPAMAWFSQQRQLKTASYINAPVNLYIASTHESNSPNIDLGDIDVYDKSFVIKNAGGDDEYYRNYVFCVRNINVNEYILQLAYTTNVPFTYEIFAAEYLGCFDGTADVNSNGKRYGTVERSEYDETNENYITTTTTINKEDDTYVIYEDSSKNRVYGYKKYGDNLLLPKRNSSGIIANDTYKAKSYSSYSEVQQNVNPVYQQTNLIKLSDDYGNYSQNLYVDAGEFSQYFVLRVSWKNSQLGDKNNINNNNNDGLIYNNKETDLIYITAGNKSSGN